MNRIIGSVIGIPITVALLSGFIFKASLGLGC